MYIKDFDISEDMSKVGSGLAGYLFCCPIKQDK